MQGCILHSEHAMDQWMDSATNDCNPGCKDSRRAQELALFARRAHRQLGRGFVLVTPDDDQPIYVTWIVGAPLPLLHAICDYDPEHEALLVVRESSDADAVIVSFIRIESFH